MLNVLFSDVLAAADKTRMLQEDFDIPANRDVEEGVTCMCNYSSYVKERGYSQGLSQGVSQGIGQGIVELLEGLGPVPSDLDLWITQETDLTVLKRWLQFAARATSIEEFREKAGI
jgi:hypothetical protein